MQDGDVHVFYGHLDVAPDLLAARAAALASDEMRHVASLQFDADRRRFIASRGLLRAVLGRHLDLPPARVEIDYAPGGKPRLKGASLHFNLSHANDIAVIALAGRAVGVDVEDVAASRANVAAAERFLAPAERAALAALSGDARRRAFFAAWTRTEARFKAGDGDDLTVRPLPLDAPYVGAVAAAGAGWRLNCSPWPGGG